MSSDTPAQPQPAPESGTAVVELQGLGPKHTDALTCGTLLLLAGELLFGFVYYNSVQLHRTLDGMELGEALWYEVTQPSIIPLAVLTALLLVIATRLAVVLPRGFTRREARVTASGLELVAHPKWWYRGQRGTIAWNNVQVISAEPTRVKEGKAQWLRPVLDVYLFREVRGVPEFRAEHVSPVLEGLKAPVFRVRIGGRGNELEMSVRELGERIGREHPELFYQGIKADQWLVPERPAGPAPEPGAPPVASTPAARPRTGLPVPEAPIWLNYRPPTAKTLGILAALPLIGAVSYLPIHLLWLRGETHTPWDILVGLLGIVLMLPFLAACIMFPMLLAMLPRNLAPLGIAVSGEGLEFVQKVPWKRSGLVRSAVPWSAVQAAVDRGTGDTPGGRTWLLDIYLWEGSDFTEPSGAGLSVATSRLGWPDSSGTDTLVSFPAVRLRLTYPRKLESGGAALWQEFLAGGPSPRELPPHQIRPALYAFHPEKCHGFEDLWQDGGKS